MKNRQTIFVLKGIDVANFKKNKLWTAAAIVIVVAVLFQIFVVVPIARQARIANGYGSPQANFNVLKRDPRDVAAHRGLAEHYLLQRDLPSAELHFRKAVQSDPQNRDSRLLLAITLQRQKKYQEALQIHQQIVAENAADSVGESAAIMIRSISKKLDNPVNGNMPSTGTP